MSARFSSAGAKDSRKEMVCVIRKLKRLSKGEAEGYVLEIIERAESDRWLKSCSGSQDGENGRPGDGGSFAIFFEDSPF